MKQTTQGQSVFDQLIVLLPEIKKNITIKNYVNPKAAKGLFTIWKDEENRLKDNLYRKPVTMSAEDVSLMEKSDLVKGIGDKIEITEKGADVIKTMILGDDKSIFEETDTIIDYSNALANTQTPSVVTAGLGRSMMRLASRLSGEPALCYLRKVANRHYKNWWKRFL